MKKLETFLLCLLILVKAIPQTSDTSLVAYYRFDGNATDQSGYGNNGSLINGASFINDRWNNPNKAIRFEKSLSQYVNVPNSTSLQIDNAITFSVWIKRNSLGGQDQVLNKGGDWPNGTCNYGLVFSDWTLCFIYNGGYYYVNSPGVPQDNDWHYYAVTTLNGTSDVRFYVDGVEKSPMFGGGNPLINLYSQSTADLNISGVNYFSDNSIDELKIFNRILTANEIKSLYLDLVAYFPFNGNCNDESGNLNDGVNYNGVFSKDRYGNDNASILFTGNDSYVEGISPGNNLPVGNSPRTITAWIKENSFHPWGNNIFHYGLDQAAPTNFHLYTTDVIRIGNGYNYGVVFGTAPVVDSTWHFVTGIYEGGTEHIAKIYVDGKLDAAGILSTEPNTILGSNWRIGRFMTGSNNFDGDIDELKIYNVALSDNEIWEMYKATTTAPNLIFPSNDSTLINPTMIGLVLDWDSTVTATGYRLLLANDSLFNTVIHDTIVNTSSFNFYDWFAVNIDNLYWKVRTINDGGIGPWSEINHFNIILTDVEDEKQLPTEFALLQNYPNPFNPATTITYHLPKNANVELKVYDVLGNEIATLVNEEKPAGSYEVEFQYSVHSLPTGQAGLHLASGVYYYQLLAGEFVQTKKMILMK